MIGIICLVLLISVGAEAAQLGRTTGEVNFRKGPDLSAPPIGRLPAGTAVEVIKRDPAGWYFVVYERQPGFVHERYIKLQQAQQNSATPDGLVRSHLVTLAGIVLMVIGAMMALRVIGRVLFKAGIILFGCALWVFAVDIAFKLGMLYSLFCAAGGLLIVLLFFARKKKNGKKSSDQSTPTIKKAA